MAGCRRVHSQSKGRFRRRHKVKAAVEVDSISSLPDVILQHILCFHSTNFAIRTSVLSKRWRHVWCDIPSLSFDSYKLKDASITETLTHYTAPKMMNFHLETNRIYNVPHIYKWIEFAMSRNVENLSLKFDFYSSDEFNIPDFFYISFSFKKLTVVELFFTSMIPRSSVSWTSLKNLSLHCCKLSDESMANILSGCPLLESLTLYFCDKLKVLDLSKSLRLRTLEVNRNVWVPGPTQIVAPHIRCLRLKNSQLQCTLVDVASLTEAKLDIFYASMVPDFKADFLQVMVLEMLQKLQHVEKLTFRGNFLHILSLAELRGVPFPMFKVKTLTLETVIFQYVIPGIDRLLQNSPDLEKLIVRAIDCNTIPEEYLDNYIKLQGLNPNQCWQSKDGVFWNWNRWDVKSKHVVSLVELALKNTKTLDKMVVLLNKRYLKFKFEELLPTLSHNNNVFIALSTDTSGDW